VPHQGLPVARTITLRKSDRIGRFLRQIQVCARCAAPIIERERAAGLAISDWRE